MLNLRNGVRYLKQKMMLAKRLSGKKINHSTWRVHLNEPTEVNIDYQVYANELGKRARHIDDSHAFVDDRVFSCLVSRFAKNL
ncbi:hypothetical protein ACOBV8_19305 (plasmid) [Pseudoalteromonas espejiana]